MELTNRAISQNNTKQKETSIWKAIHIFICNKILSYLYASIGVTLKTMIILLWTISVLFFSITIYSYMNVSPIETGQYSFGVWVHWMNGKNRWQCKRERCVFQFISNAMSCCCSNIFNMIRFCCCNSEKFVLICAQMTRTFVIAFALTKSLYTSRSLKQINLIGNGHSHVCVVVVMVIRLE